MQKHSAVLLLLLTSTVNSKRVQPRDAVALSGTSIQDDDSALSCPTIILNQKIKALQEKLRKSQINDAEIDQSQDQTVGEPSFAQKLVLTTGNKEYEKSPSLTSVQREQIFEQPEVLSVGDENELIRYQQEVLTRGDENEQIPYQQEVLTRGDENEQIPYQPEVLTGGDENELIRYQQEVLTRGDENEQIPYQPEVLTGGDENEQIPYQQEVLTGGDENEQIPYQSEVLTGGDESEQILDQQFQIANILPDYNLLNTLKTGHSLAKQFASQGQVNGIKKQLEFESEEEYNQYLTNYFNSIVDQVLTKASSQLSVPPQALTAYLRKVINNSDFIQVIKKSIEEELSEASDESEDEIPTENLVGEQLKDEQNFKSYIEFAGRRPTEIVNETYEAPLDDDQVPPLSETVLGQELPLVQERADDSEIVRTLLQKQVKNLKKSEGINADENILQRLIQSYIIDGKPLRIRIRRIRVVPRMSRQDPDDVLSNIFDSFYNRRPDGIVQSIKSEMFPWGFPQDTVPPQDDELSRFQGWAQDRYPREMLESAYQQYQPFYPHPFYNEFENQPLPIGTHVPLRMRKRIGGGPPLCPYNMHC